MGGQLDSACTAPNLVALGAGAAARLARGVVVITTRAPAPGPPLLHASASSRRRLDAMRGRLRVKYSRVGLNRLPPLRGRVIARAPARLTSRTRTARLTTLLHVHQGHLLGVCRGGFLAALGGVLAHGFGFLVFWFLNEATPPFRGGGREPASELLRSLTLVWCCRGHVFRATVVRFPRRTIQAAPRPLCLELCQKKPWRCNVTPARGRRTLLSFFSLAVAWSACHELILCLPHFYNRAGGGRPLTRTS
jgi:hypothetical protein